MQPMHTPEDSATLPAERTRATSILKTIFSVDFHLAGDGAPAANSVALALSADGTISRALAMHALKSALSRMRTRDKENAQRPLEMLAASFVRAQATSTTETTFLDFWKDMCVLFGTKFPDYHQISNLNGVLKLLNTC